MVIMAWYGMIWYGIIILYVLNLNLTINFGHCSISALMPIFWATGNSADFFCRKWMTMYDGGAKCMFGSLGIRGNVPYDKPKLSWKFVFFILPETNPASLHPENGWLEDGSLSKLEWPIFSCFTGCRPSTGRLWRRHGQLDISNHRKKQRENPRTGRPWTGWKGHGFFKFQRLTSQSCITEAGNLYVFSRTSWNFEVCDLDAKQIPHLTPRNFCEQKLQAWLRTTQEKKKFETASATLRRRSEHEIDGVEGGFKNLQKKCCIELASFSCVFFCLEVLWGAQKSGCHPGHKRAEVFFISRYKGKKLKIW